MGYRRPNQDQMPVGGQPEEEDATYREASYLGMSEDDEEVVHDLGFIVEDRRDERATLTGDWERLDDLDTDEPLETNRSGRIPHKKTLIERGAPMDWFATDYHLSHAEAEAQEEDFVQTSMLDTDPETNAGAEDFTDESLEDPEGEPEALGIRGRAPGVIQGLGTALPQDIGSEGFDVRDNPLMRRRGAPMSSARLSDEATGRRQLEEMGTESELERLADRAAREEERAPGPQKQPARRRRSQ
jgi:hypothetical protein